MLYFDYAALRLPKLAKLDSNKRWKFPGAQFYPDGANKVIGFVDWRLIQATQLDHIYTAGYFLGLLGLLGASLAACTATRQWPAVRVARRCAVAGKHRNLCFDIRSVEHPCVLIAIHEGRISPGLAGASLAARTASAWGAPRRAYGLGETFASRPH